MTKRDITTSHLYKVTAQSWPTHWVIVKPLQKTGLNLNNQQLFNCLIIESHWQGLDVGTVQEVCAEGHRWEYISTDDALEELCKALGIPRD